MRHTLTGAIALFLIIASTSLGADVIAAPSYSVTNAMNDAQTFITDTILFQTTTISLTNCIALDTDNTSTQGLSGITVEFKIGTASVNTAYTGTVYVVGGLTNQWYLNDIVLPTSTTTPYCQTKLIDSLSAVRIYPWRKLKTQAGM